MRIFIKLKPSRLKLKPANAMRKSFLGVSPETKFKKNVKANRTEIDNVIFSPPIFGKWNTDITIPKRYILDL